MKIQGTRPEGAPFEPISPAVSISNLLVTTPNFKPVQRIDARRITPANLDSLGSVIKDHVITKGLPLVLENWHLRSDWPKWHFNPEWLKENHGADHIAVRDIPHKSDMLMSLRHYLNNLGKLASKFSPSNYVSGKQQRLYGKDLDCPPVWRNSLANILPSSTTYLSPKADLMSSLPPDARAENLMCYIGHEGTYTPAHKEMCASLGQNIMVYASQNGPNSEAGSSVWFMTGMDERDQVAEYWLGSLGHDIEVEAHFASLENLQKAPFTVYIVEQKLGDYILVPPLAPHQVWNRGTCTMKVAWNRTTAETLQLAMQEALPKARIVCRDEQYKNKNIIYDTLKRWTKILRQGTDVDKNAPSTIKTDYRKLFDLFNIILLDECFSPLLPAEKKVELIPNDYNVTCSFCRGNIFNRFLSCKRCSAHSDDIEPYDVCMDCYARGRSCYCVSGLSWVEQYPWSELLKAHADFRSLILELETSDVTFDLPKSLQDALPLFHRKTLARVCQEVLKTRPYVNPDVMEEPDDPKDIERKKKKGELLKCHPCCHLHPSWKAALCSSPDCTKAYCYGNLWRAFDMDPFFDVLSKFEWKCPFCLQICSCGTCRKRGKGNPYVPRGTILGSVTKHVSDPRSVESLVDFGKGNAGWRVDGITGNKRKRYEDGDGQSINDDDGALKSWAPGFNNLESNTTVVPAENIDPALTANFPSMESPDGGSSFDDENKKVATADEHNMFKADSSAAGLEVVQIPIDPALGGDELRVPNQSVGLSESYARLFENPTTAFAPTSESQSYLFSTNHTATTVLSTINYHSNGIQHGYHDSEMEEDTREHVNSVQDNENGMGLDDVEDNGHHESARLPPAPTETFWGPDQQEQDHGSPSNGFHPASYNSNSLHNLLPQTTTLSALEKNPLAFLAAAGLLHAGQQENSADHWDGNSFDHAQGVGAQGPSNVAAMDGYIPEGLSANAPGSISQDLSKSNVGKRKAEKIESDVFVSNLPETRNSAISEWVFKQKKGSKKRKLNGPKIVVLKISPEAWRRYNERIESEKEEKARKLMKRFGDGDVKTDITPNCKKRRGPQRSPSVEWKKSKSVGHPVSPPKEVRRGRPSKKTYIEVDSDDEGSVASAGETLEADIGENEETLKGRRTSRRSMRTGDLVDGLENVAPKRRRGGPGPPRKHQSTSLVGKTSESPEPPPIQSPNGAHQTPLVETTRSPTQMPSVEGREDERAQPISSTAQVEEMAEESPIEVKDQKKSEPLPTLSEHNRQLPANSAPNSSPDGDSPDIRMPSKPFVSTEIAATENTADSSDEAMDFGAASISDDDDNIIEDDESAEEVLETEEQRRKRLVAEALAEAKSAALRVAEGVPATEVVSAGLPPFTTLPDAKPSNFDDEESVGDESIGEAGESSNEVSLQHDHPSTVSPIISPQSPSIEANKPNSTLFEIVIFRRNPGWAAKAGYIEVTIPEDFIGDSISNRETLTPETPIRSPSIIPAVEPVVVQKPVAINGKSAPPARKRGRPNQQAKQSSPYVMQGSTFSHSSIPSKSSDIPSTPSIETTKRRDRQPRSQSSTSEPTSASVDHVAATEDDQVKPKSQKRGRPRQEAAQERQFPLAVGLVLDKQQSPPLAKSTPRARGRPSRGSLNNRSPAIPTSSIHNSPPSARRTSFTSINRKNSGTPFSIEMPPIVQKSLPLSQKASRGRGRPSRGRGSVRFGIGMGRKSAISNASNESNDALFFREMLGGDYFSPEVMTSLKGTDDTSSRVLTEKSTTKASPTVVNTSKEDDDMEWWD